MRETELRDPSRLADENVTAFEQALLAAGRSYGSSTSARNKTLAALGVAGSATLLAGTAQAVPLGTLAKMTWGKILAAVSLAGAAAAVPGYYAWQHHQAAEAAARSGALSAKMTETTAQAAPMPEPASAPTARLARAVDEPMGAGTGTGSDDKAPAHLAARAATLGHELSTLDAARGMLARGDASGALARLDRYGRAYPHGRLALEAEVLRIDALDAAGRSDAARTRAQAFLERHPHSVLAARVRTRLGD
jgi:hypothetical protein